MSEANGMNAFKKWAVENGYTARMVAEKSGVNLRTVRSYMQGTRLPSRENMKRLEEAFDIDTRELFPL